MVGDEFAPVDVDLSAASGCRSTRTMPCPILTRPPRRPSTVKPVKTSRKKATSSGLGRRSLNQVLNTVPAGKVSRWNSIWFPPRTTGSGLPASSKSSWASGLTPPMTPAKSCPSVSSCRV